MTEIEYLAEVQNNDAECLRRLIFIVANALPHTEQECAELYSRWNSVRREVNAEYKAAQESDDG